ncbi:MlaD family protein [Gallaecimonas mangrovi]|uniref:MlaD family protein n=1 Tax=Gallaecimonas mangrovi TaxID=2291597 RepID=UPI000E1FEA9F|nr:MlaD family protein [Gallaecimonas mangrovi]
MKKTVVKVMDQPEIRRVRRLSLVWVVPFLAIALASYLIYQQFVERGLLLTLTFPEAKGLVPGKTELRYQGFKVGVVSHLSFNAKSGEFTAHISAMRDLEPLLKDHTQFWLVKPTASLLGVSGLDTLLSGNYIAMLPGTGKPKRDFVARRTPPPEPVPEGMFMVELALHNLGTLTEGSPIYYRKVPIGQVHSYRLDKGGDAVILQLTFDKNYADLVKRDSHFKDVSGIKVKADLSGIKLDAGGLVSMLTGGLQMDSPDDSPPAKYGQRYVLDKERRFSHQVHLTLATPTFLPKGTPIIARQHVIGEVVDSNDSGVLLGFNEEPINPFYAWIAQRSLKNLDATTLLHPRYIRLLQGVDGRHQLHEQPPLPGPHDSELLLRLVSAKKLADGTPIQYKGFTVGEVIYSTLQGEQAIAEVSIEGDYRHFIHKNSQFHSTEPLQVDASFQHLQLKTAPLETWWQGAIALTPGTGAAAPYNSQFQLDPQQQALMQTVTLSASPPRSLPADTPIHQHGFTVGKVVSSTLAKGGQKAVITVEIRKDLAVSPLSRFYWKPPLDLKADLRGIHMKVADLASAVAGSIEMVQANTADAKSSRLLFSNRQSALAVGPEVTLKVPLDSDVQPGIMVKYFGNPIGKVVSLKDSGQYRLLTLRFDGELGQRFARQGSAFSLVTPEISIAGIKHLDAVIAPYIAAVPGDKASPLQDHFSLSPTLYPHQEFTLAASRGYGLSVGAPVWYRDLPVGEILSLSLMPSGKGVYVKVAINNEAAHWVSSSSQFWVKAGFNASFGLFDGLKLKSDTLQSIAQGGVQFATKGAGKTVTGPLPLSDVAPKDWQHWAPSAVPAG